MQNPNPSEIARLRDIMKQLRDPVKGCPWDIKQDFKSIAPYTLEEAYEVVDAIHHGDSEQICDELGDLLLQVVFHAQMAEEQGLFSFDDVVAAICEKMIRRHPHVFGDKTATSSDEVKKNWEDIKAEERHAKTKGNTSLPSLLDDVPVTLPAMSVAMKYQKRAAKVGFDWPDMDGVIDKLREEVDECEHALQQRPQDKTHIKEEIGDILFAAANLARKAGVDAEIALLECNSKFNIRFRYIEEKVNQTGEDITSVKLDVLEHYWQQAKRYENTNSET